MTMRFTSAGVLAVAVLVAAAPEEGAASPVLKLSTVTFYGTVTSGTDVTGVFGEEGADLTGLKYEMSYRVMGTYEEPYVAEEYDGVRHENFNPGLYGGVERAILTINNRGYSFDSSYWSYASASSGSNANYPFGLWIQMHAETHNRVGQYPCCIPFHEDVSRVDQSFRDPTDHQIRSLLTPVALLANGPQMGSFDLKWLTILSITGEYITGLHAFGTLNAERMVIHDGSIAPIPLPATVGPFLLALGLGGVISRRRKRRT